MSKNKIIPAIRLSFHLGNPNYDKLICLLNVITKLHNY